MSGMRIGVGDRVIIEAGFYVWSIVNNPGSCVTHDDDGMKGRIHSWFNLDGERWFRVNRDSSWVVYAVPARFVRLIERSAAEGTAGEE